MNQRILIFDYLRSLSILGIILCHFSFNWDKTMFLGRFLGNTFNVLFLGMSALLLGNTWYEKGRNSLELVFLKHRFGKLVRSYNPFLVFMFLFLYFIAGKPIRLKSVFLHFAFLPWLDRLQGFEHLWFLTMIAFCYVVVYLFSKLKHINTLQHRTTWCLAISLFVVVVHHIMLRFGLPGSLFLYLWIFVLLFFHSPQIIHWVREIPVVLSVTLSAFLLLLILILFSYGLYDQNRQVAETLGVVSAGCSMVIVMKLLPNVQQNQFISFISKISFELYLVHHVFCFGQYSVMKVIGSPFIGFIVLLLISVLLAYALHPFKRIG